MIAFDTNLLVRVAVRDDESQVTAARELMRANTVLLPRTVLLEAEWVLRVRYTTPRSVLEGFFRALLDAQDVVVEDAELVARALDWYALGADFADALHLAACGSALLHTFDRSFCKAARAAGVAPEIRVLDANAH